MTISSLFKERTSLFSCLDRPLNSPEWYIPEKEMKRACIHLLRDRNSLIAGSHQQAQDGCSSCHVNFSPLHGDISTEFRWDSNYLFTDHLTTAKLLTTASVTGVLAASPPQGEKSTCSTEGINPSLFYSVIKFLKVIGTAWKSLLLFQVWLKQTHRYKT